MVSDDMRAKDRREEGAEYEAVLILEDLESLLEDLEDSGDSAQLPVDLRTRMDDLGISSATELRKRILELHAQLDAEDA